MKILIINGPNLQLLGKREVEIYGKTSLKDIENKIEATACELGGVQLDFFQSNHEGAILDKIGTTFKVGYDGIIINPAAFTHTSLAIYDALKAVDIPTIEVHISNIYKREDFRAKSVIAAACIGQISGFGIKGYKLAMLALFDIINNKGEK